MNLLAIETSCDETAIALVSVKDKKGATSFNILGSEVSSQIELHREYGGVFPNLAKREHIKNLPIVLEKVIKKSKIKKSEIDAIAVTTGPGLEPALWTGITFAKELNKEYNIPIIPVNHMEGHIFSIFPKENKNTFTVKKDKKMLPILSLLVSGGHTELILIKDWNKYKKIGQTRDDAVGEAFDKVARMLGLPYPGGPEISKLAGIKRENTTKNKLLNFSRSGTSSSLVPARNADRITTTGGREPEELVDPLKQILFPRPMIHSKDYDFSFSGLKTAVLYLIRDLKTKDPNILDKEEVKQEIAKEFEDAAIEVLVHKTIKAIKQYEVKNLIVGGGVSANKHLQDEMKKNIKQNKLKVKIHFPNRELTGDNALMITIAGYFQYKNNKFVKSHKSLKLKARGNLSL